MNSEKYDPRILGAVFFIVAVTSILSEVLFSSIIGSGNMSDSLVNISNNIMQMRISILLDLITSVGIIVLATLLFILLKKQNKIIALVALGFYLGEAIILAISKTSVYFLLSVSREFVNAESPISSHYQTLGIIFLDFVRAGYNTHMLFFGLGGILFYCLFYQSKVIPSALSIFGILAISMALIGALLGFFDIFIIVLIVPNVLFELTIGIWLMVKGINEIPSK